MTETQIKILKNKSLKQKLSESKERMKIQVEIDNYETAIRQGTKFMSYNLDMVVKLKGRLLEVGNDNN
jgi:hypothetical protein|tara:strand:- start:1196 stop:1399 length:204 start_codon:yes stop_codon:yes gene_type:complete